MYDQMGRNVRHFFFFGGGRKKKDPKMYFPITEVKFSFMSRHSINELY